MSVNDPDASAGAPAADPAVDAARTLRGSTGGETATVPWSAPTVRVVLASTLLVPLGVSLISPALPVFRDAFGLSDAGASLLISTYFATGIVLSPFIGLLEDRVGRRGVLIPSLLVFSVAGFAIAVAPSFEVAFALRVVQGTGAAGILITTVTLIGDTFDGVQRSAVLGANTAALSAAAALYPILGGVLAAVAWNVPFYGYLLGLPVALFAFRTLEEPDVAHEARDLGSFGRVIEAMSIREAVLLYGSALLIEFLLFGAVFTVLPFLLATTYGISPVGIGFAITGALAASAVAASQAGRFAEHLSDERLVAVGFGSAGLGLVGAWLAPTPVLIGLSSVVFGAGWGISMPAIDDAVSDHVPDGYRAEALSLRNSTTFLGRSVAPILVAGLAAVWGYPPLLLVAGLGGLTSALLVVALTLGSPDRPSDPAVED